MRPPAAIRLLDAADAPAWQRLRLRGLAECPTAFASSLEEEEGRTLSDVAERLAPDPDRAVFGAFDAGPAGAGDPAAGALVGIVGLQREAHRKLAHKAFLWGMYVAPSHRRAGVGRALVEQALAHARQGLHVRQVILGVNAANVAALRLYEAMGFVRFGLEPAFMLVDGRLHDEVHMVCVVES